MAKQFSEEEVSKHNQESDLWIVIHGGVYNLTNFLNKHPGGEEVLIELAGKDGTQCFDEIGHSGEAIQLRDTFKIGEISGAIQPKDQTSTSDGQEASIDDDNWEYHEPEKVSNPWHSVVVSAGVIFYGFLFYYLFYS